MSDAPVQRKSLTDLPGHLAHKSLCPLLGIEERLALRVLCKHTRAWCPPERVPLDEPRPHWIIKLAAQANLGDPWAQCRLIAKVCASGELDNVQRLRSQLLCAWDEKASAAAAQHGHLKVLQWLLGQEPPCPWYADMFCAPTAREDGHEDVVKWLCAQDLISLSDYVWDEDRGGEVIDDEE